MLKGLRKLIIMVVATSTILFSTTIVVFAQSDTPDEFKSEVLVRMRSREASFSINYTGNPTEFIQQAKTLIKEASKPDEYLNLSLAKESVSISGSSGNLNVFLTVDYLTTKEQEAIVDQKLSEIVSEVVTSDMTTHQKIKALHDYVCSITSYDYTFLRNSAYTALTEGKTMSKGYTLLLYRLFDKVGIPTHIVEGMLKGVSHTWNMVEMDGMWYHIDATNNDSSNTSKYYMVSDIYLTSYGFVWIKSDYPSATDEGTEIPQSQTIAQQKVIEATNALFIAETSLTLEDKVSAEILINALPAVSEKTALVTRLTILKQTITLNFATASVIMAEVTPTQDNINLANQAIGIMPTGDNKTELQERIIAINTAILAAIYQQKLQPAINAVIKAETSILLIDINSAQIIVNTLPTGNDKTSLISRLNIVKQYVTTTNLVVIAEQVKTLVSVNTATKSVNLLTDGSVKTALQGRVQAVQTIINNVNLVSAANAVTKAETSLLIIDVINAQKLITALVDGDDKVALQEKLTMVSQKILQNAINAVSKVEVSLTLEDKASAEKLVNALPIGTDKTSLILRLKTVNQYIVTTNLVVTAEKVKTQVSVNAAINSVNLLIDGSVKSALQGRVQAIQTIIDNVNLVNSTNAVNKAETSLLTIDVLNAQKLVTILVDGADKAALQEKLTMVSQKILQNAIDAVAKVEVGLALEDKVSAEKLVNALPIGTDKTSLILRLKTVNQYIVTTNLVITAERVKTQVSVTVAINSVNLLIDGSVKSALQGRLQTVQTIIDNVNLVNSTNAVNKAEASLLTIDVLNAQKLVTILVDGTEKVALQERLTMVSQKNLQNALNAAAKAEASLMLEDKVSAEKLVNALPIGTDKTSLILRLKSVNQYIVATNLVVTAERVKTQSSVNTAINSVNLLIDGSVKSALQGRLQAVQTIIHNVNLVNSTNAVNKAEASLLTIDVVNAQKLVSILVDGVDKTALQNKLTTVSQEILQNAINAVIKAEASLILADKTSAEKLVNGLPTGTDKTSLTSRVKTVNQYIVTTNLVVIAEKAITQTSVNTAIKAVNLLPEGSVKTTLKQRLQAIKIVIQL